MSSLKFTPNLVTLYIKYTNEIYGINIFVHENKHIRFLELEHVITSAGGSPKTYAKLILLYWKEWIKELGLEYPPVNLFLGKKSWERFLVVMKMPTVMDSIKGNSEESLKDAIILRDEIEIALVTIKQNGKLSEKEIIKLLQLSDEWEEADRRPKRKALDIVEEILGIVTETTDYQKLGKYYNQRRLHYGPNNWESKIQN